MAILRFIYYVALFTCLASCSKLQKADILIDVHHQIDVPECTTFVNGGVDYRICFDSVAADSRCALGAACVWAGVAKVNFTLHSGGNSNQFSLYTGGAAGTSIFPDNILLGGIKIRLIRLTPEPAINIRFSYAAYKVAIQISTR